MLNPCHISAPRAQVYQALIDPQADEGTNIFAVHERVPPGVAPADNETGWRMTLDKLATLVETK